MKNEYLIYCRKSTDEEDSQVNSLDVQESECLKYAKSNHISITSDNTEGLMKNGIIRESHSAFKTGGLSFSNDGLMGYQIERPKFMQMIGLLVKGGYKGVIVLCWDRISRNEKDDMIIKELMDNRKIDIRFVQVNYEKSAGGKLHRGIDGLFSQYYSETISFKVKTTFEKLVKEGRYVGRAPIGYLDEGSDNKPIDPVRGPIVKKLLELYAEGNQSISSLHKIALERGLTTKPSKKRNIKDGTKYERPVSKRTIEEMLKNRFYVGDIKFRGDWLPGKHTPLISMKTFIQIQENLKKNYVSASYDNLLFFPYRGAIKCACGRVYSPSLKKKKFIIYSAKCKDGCDNKIKNLNEKAIDDIIAYLISKLSFSDKQLKAIEERLNKDIDNVGNERNKRFNELTNKKTKLMDDLDFLKKNKLKFLKNGTYSGIEYNQEKQKILDSMKDIDKMFNIQTETEEEMLKYVEDFSELIKMACTLYKKGTEKEKQEICNLIFSELVVKDGCVASYKAKEGFQELLDNNFKNPSEMASGRVGVGRYKEKNQEDFSIGEPYGVRTHGLLDHNQAL